MSFVVQLLGHPAIHDGGERSPAFRSRKSWALLAYLLSTERPPSRRQLAALLFGEADDPLRALRWSISTFGYPDFSPCLVSLQVPKSNRREACA